MARYIDADALKEELESLRVVVTGLRLGKGVLHDYITEYRKSVLRIVHEQPTADVVEVVRCKDCIHKVDFMCRVMCSRKAQKHGNEYYHLTATDNEHYCSYGERNKE